MNKSFKIYVKYLYYFELKNFFIFYKFSCYNDLKLEELWDSVCWRKCIQSRCVEHSESKRVYKWIVTCYA